MRGSNIDKTRGSRGFSLFEVSSILMVMVALSAITIPGMYSIYSAYKLSSTTQAISATLEGARALALRDGRPVSVIFNASQRQFGVDENQNGKLDPAEAYQAPAGITFAPYVTVTFMPDGALPPGVTSTAISVSNGGETRSLNIQPSGLIETS